MFQQSHFAVLEIVNFYYLSTWQDVVKAFPGKLSRGGKTHPKHGVTIMCEVGPEQEGERRESEKCLNSLPFSGPFDANKQFHITVVKGMRHFCCHVSLPWWHYVKEQAK